ncbi:putative peptide/nitrate transporter [Vitis vinifera]|uniref:Putative peptide/nitrate transporter n=1 Tax=Vitis vinifera TaxID=29760 RepID=A0A438EAX0_VITVI|nr:putative peptide/nitrate transporter [Vitis vinifera]
MILLIQPAEKYPNIFSKESIFGRFPYFLPCLCTSVYAFGITIACCWLQVEGQKADMQPCMMLSARTLLSYFSYNLLL